MIPRWSVGTLKLKDTLWLDDLGSEWIWNGGTTGLRQSDFGDYEKETETDDIGVENAKKKKKMVFESKFEMFREEGSDELSQMLQLRWGMKIDHWI